MLHQINSATASPCNGFCELDKIKKMCKGCFRTMTEIISWQNYTDEQKLEVLKKAQERKSQMKHN